VRDIDDITAEMGHVSTRLLFALGNGHLLDDSMRDLLALGDELAEVLPQNREVPRFTAGLAWLIFTEMLRMARVAPNRDLIEFAAWQWQAKLYRAFDVHMVA
jgi:hypothetical protein